MYEENTFNLDKNEENYFNIYKEIIESGNLKEKDKKFTYELEELFSFKSKYSINELKNQLKNLLSFDYVIKNKLNEKSSSDTNNETTSLNDVYIKNFIKNKMVIFYYMKFWNKIKDIISSDEHYNSYKSKVSFNDTIITNMSNTPFQGDKEFERFDIINKLKLLFDEESKYNNSSNHDITKIKLIEEYFKEFHPLRILENKDCYINFVKESLNIDDYIAIFLIDYKGMNIGLTKLYLLFFNYLRTYLNFTGWEVVVNTTNVNVDDMSKFDYTSMWNVTSFKLLPIMIPEFIKKCPSIRVLILKVFSNMLHHLYVPLL